VNPFIALLALNMMAAEPEVKTTRTEIIMDGKKIIFNGHQQYCHCRAEAEVVRFENGELKAYCNKHRPKYDHEVEKKSPINQYGE